MYDKVKEQWNNIFKKREEIKIISKETGIREFDDALDWLCTGVENVLDFGCGNGVLLHKIAARGVKELIGIDISEEGIRIANILKQVNDVEKSQFIVGGVESLEKLEDNCVDAIVLSNIIDNLSPKDSIKVIKECKRILKTNGKVLVKLNPYITEEQIKEWDIKVIENNFLDDGLFLWNQTSKEWFETFKEYFNVIKNYDICYDEHNQTNRIYLLKG